MIRIAITPAAFDAIVATLPPGSVGYERAPNATGEGLIWLEPAVINRLGAMRGPRRELQRRRHTAPGRDRGETAVLAARAGYREVGRGSLVCERAYFRNRDSGNPDWRYDRLERFRPDVLTQTAIVT
jgi:hypothetical protein